MGLSGGDYAAKKGFDCTQKKKKKSLHFRGHLAKITQDTSKYNKQQTKTLLGGNKPRSKQDFFQYRGLCSKNPLLKTSKKRSFSMEKIAPNPPEGGSFRGKKRRHHPPKGSLKRTAMDD